MANSYQTKKIVVVGDSQVGKTSLLYTLHNGRRPTAQELRQFSCYSVSLVYPTTLPEPPSFCSHHLKDLPTPNFDALVIRRSSSISLVDTISAEDYGRLRSYSYRESQLIVICFSIGSRRSLRNVLDRWHPELLLFTPDTPVLLVGCKSEIRTFTTENTVCQSKDEDEDECEEGPIDCVSTEEGRAMAERINALGYLECSAKRGLNMDKLKSTLHWCSIALKNDSAFDRPQAGCIIA